MSHHVLVSGWSACPFHAAALKCLRSMAAWGIQLEVKEFPDMHAFRQWLAGEGYDSQSSPLCVVDAHPVGGYGELRAWLVEVMNRKLQHKEARISVLSLKKHLQGRWLVDLRMALALRGEPSEVFCVEEENVWDTGPCAGARWKAMLNCVSDAAPAHLQRRLLAAMADAESQGLLVRNGLQAFTACGGKVAQHALLRRHGLKCPRSRVVSETTGARLAELATDLRYPLLLKPNAGGFGKGIQSFASAEDLATSAVSFGEDGLALLQERHSPPGGMVGRIWMLDGKVLCAVLAPMMDVGSDGPSGCMADGRAAQAARAWQVPAGLQADCERILQVAQATWGSIEVLDCDGEWLFFDLNLSCISSPTLQFDWQHWLLIEAYKIL